ncbi:TlpA disulfide reductase family protein [Sulfobacillus sp. hq2]|uniref:TlpA family protein disulfide reductase n=1 Tax=Sulfobacillus TaxID=28033 RepID=UPI001FA91A9F|nr:TlpA disulfide reductase family protein [Sulfobacillus sp. hq2]
MSLAMKRWAGWIVLLAALIYAGFLVGRGTKPHTVAAPKTKSTASASTAQYGLTAGQFAPNFTLTTTAGQTVSLASLRGHPVWLNFWATWCPWCNKEIPQIEKVQASYAGRIDIYGVDVQQSQATVAQYMKAKGVNYPVLLDTQGAVAAAYGVQGLPMSVFIGPHGRIRAIYSGALLSPQSIAPYLHKLLASS